MKKLLYLLVLLLVVTPVFAQSWEGWIEKSVVPYCVAIVTSQGIGTGLIVTENGYILTNRHVVGKSKEYITIYTSDFRTHGARVVGYHSTCDIAVLKMEAKEALKCWDKEKMIANPKMIFLGEDVYALGHPFGIPYTVTRGIISQRHKFGDGEVYWQTDASINQGNSGGPLFDENGNLIGINTMGYPPFLVENIALAIAVYAFVDEVIMIIEEDMKRLQIIEDVWEYVKEERTTYYDYKSPSGY